MRSIGYTCGFLPLELVHAAGFLPVRVLGEGDGADTALAESYLRHNVCSFARSCFSQCTSRSSGFDAVVATSTCDAMRGVADNIEYFDLAPLLTTVDVPRSQDRESHRRYFFQQITRLAERLEEQAGAAISDEALRDSIAVFNRLRASLRALQGRGVVASSELYALVHRALTEPPLEVLAVVEDALASEGPPAKTTPPIRVVLLGSCQPAGPGLLDIIDDSGGIVVGDLLCSGARFFSRDVEAGDDPLEALVDHYWDAAHCARMYPLSIREDAVRALVVAAEPHVVIHNSMKFCDPYLYDAVHMRRLAGELRVPFLALETEVGTGGSGQLLTRVQTFFERVDP